MSNLIQKEAPQFEEMTVLDGEMSKFALSSLKGKYVVLLFYPLDFTFVCPTELWAFSDAKARFDEIDTEVVAVSVDSSFSHLRWSETERKDGGLKPMKLRMVADITKSIAKKYGVLIEDGDDAGVALRGTFIISENQTVRSVMVNDLPVGRSVDETIRLVKAFKQTDEFGEVCPAGWTPGKSTMKPDPTGSKEFFGAVGGGGGGGGADTKTESPKKRARS